MSEKLVAPVRSYLDERLEEGKVRALWARIDGARPSRGVPVARAFAYALASALVALCGAYLLLRPAPATALHLADGEDVPVSLGSLDGRVAFDDESRIETDAGARVDVLESTGHAFALALRRGTASFVVHPGGPRTWRVECGGVTVEVVGTVFSVARAAHAVRVAVTRGSVLVRGDTVPDRVARLGAGESLTVPLAEPVAPNAVPAEAPSGAVAPAGAAELAPSGPAGKTAPVLREAPPTPVGQGAAVPPPAAVTAPSTAESAAAFPDPAPPAPSVDERFALADAARKAGRLAEAAGRLQAILADHPDAHHAALAEFSLGRLSLDSMGDAAEGGRHFTRALAVGLPAALAEDAQARLVEAFARSGDRAAAANAAARYHALYPGGRRAHDVNRWISASP